MLQLGNNNTFKQGDLKGGLSVQGVGLPTLKPTATSGGNTTGAYFNVNNLVGGIHNAYSRLGGVSAEFKELKRGCRGGNGEGAFAVVKVTP